MDKILSIIIPTYNMEKYLDKCLSSLILEDKELMKILEVLVIIDGAKDHSSEIAHTYQDKYPDTFVVIDKENGNYGSCINRGLKEATGKYLKVLDADDCFNTAAFGKLLRCISQITFDVDVLFSGYKVVDGEGAVKSEYTRDLTPHTLLGWREITKSCVKGRHVAMHEITYRVAMLKEMNYVQTEGISYTDQEWIFYPMSSAKSFYLINEFVYLYLTGRTGQTMDPAVLQKGVGANISIAERMIECYHGMLKKANDATDYLTSNLLWLLNHIYSICLLSNMDGVELVRLSDFDASLFAKAPDLYVMVSSFKTPLVPKVNVRYARKWQKSKNKNTIPLSVKSLLFFRGLMK